MKTLRVGEVASLFGVRSPIVLKLIKSGALVAVNISTGRRAPRYRISPESVDAFLASRNTAHGDQGDGAR